MAKNRPPQKAQEPRSGSTQTEATLENRPICAGIAVPLLEPGDAQKHAAQGRKAAPAGGPIGTKSGGSITPKSGGPIQTKSGGSNHSKSCIACLASGRLRQFCGSIIGVALFLLSAWLLYTQVLSGHVLSSGPGDPSLLSSILFLIAFGIPGISYTIKVRFGFRRGAV